MSDGREIDERDLAWLNDARRALTSTGCQVKATSSLEPVEHGVEFELTVFAPNRTTGLGSGDDSVPDTTVSTDDSGGGDS